jgi:hypothetical protein
MNFLKSFTVALFCVVLTNCVSFSSVEGTVISSKEIEYGITEYLIETNSYELPYYILRVRKDNFKQGSKVVLELPVNSLIHSKY